MKCKPTVHTIPLSRRPSPKIRRNRTREEELSACLLRECTELSTRKHTETEKRTYSLPYIEKEEWHRQPLGVTEPAVLDKRTEVGTRTSKTSRRNPWVTTRGRADYLNEAKTSPDNIYYGNSARIPPGGSLRERISRNQTEATVRDDEETLDTVKRSNI